MPKNRPPKYKQEYHGNAAEPDWWRKALKRHKQGQTYPDQLSAMGFAQLIADYLEGEIPAAIFGVSFLKAHGRRVGLSDEVEDLLWAVHADVRSLPGFDEIDDVNELPDSTVKGNLAPLLNELRWLLEREAEADKLE